MLYGSYASGGLYLHLYTVRGKFGEELYLCCIDGDRGTLHIIT